MLSSCLAAVFKALPPVAASLLSGKVPGLFGPGLEKHRELFTKHFLKPFALKKTPQTRQTSGVRVLFEVLRLWSCELCTSQSHNDCRRERCGLLVGSATVGPVKGGALGWCLWWVYGGIYDVFLCFEKCFCENSEVFLACL